MDRVVARLDESRMGDFHALHCDANGAGWCFCAAWHVPTWEGWGQRSADENRLVRERLCDAGEYDGYLLYDRGVPVGWCQVGPRDRLAKLVRQFNLPPDPNAWAITCFLIAPNHRRRGLSSFLLDEVLADLRSRGVQRVQAFPKRGAELEVDDLWNGPEAMFRRAGFIVTRDDAARPILEIELHSSG